jgi:ubiquinone biosynthesis protein COQ4
MPTLEYKINIPAALHAFWKLMRNPDADISPGVEMVKHLNGKSMERFFQRFVADPKGASILRERRSLFAMLKDRQAMANLPAGSLGRIYFEWTEMERISAVGLASANEGGLPEGIDDERRLVMERHLQIHDLLHVTGGYGRDFVGELAVVSMALIQVRQMGLLLPVALGSLYFGLFRGRHRVLKDARRRARQSVWMPVQDWEGLLARPLGEVRETLGLGPPPIYIPLRGSLVADSPDGLSIIGGRGIQPNSM